MNPTQPTSLSSSNEHQADRHQQSSFQELCTRLLHKVWYWIRYPSFWTVIIVLCSVATGVVVDIWGGYVYYW